MPSPVTNGAREIPIVRARASRTRLRGTDEYRECGRRETHNETEALTSHWGFRSDSAPGATTSSSGVQYCIRNDMESLPPGRL